MRRSPGARAWKPCVFKGRLGLGRCHDHVLAPTAKMVGSDGGLDGSAVAATSMARQQRRRHRRASARSGSRPRGRLARVPRKHRGVPLGARPSCALEGGQIAGYTIFRRIKLTRRKLPVEFDQTIRPSALSATSGGGRRLWISLEPENRYSLLVFFCMGNTTTSAIVHFSAPCLVATLCVVDDMPP